MWWLNTHDTIGRGSNNPMVTITMVIIHYNILSYRKFAFSNMLHYIIYFISAGKLSRSQKEEDLELPLFDLATVVCATCNFSNDNKLGEGGFGSVFKVKSDDTCSFGHNLDWWILVASTYLSELCRLNESEF